MTAIQHWAPSTQVASASSSEVMVTVSIVCCSALENSRSNLVRSPAFELCSSAQVTARAMSTRTTMMIQRTRRLLSPFDT
ncbi:hypothetical protein [Propionibacterium australiense]|uniref:hypothetical protein n=1 Tax=Propionibacterium australiense TaxID=119981 RepID=UPI001600FBE7|nr:hypothetical protein [Propionibacterium australiense]